MATETNDHIPELPQPESPKEGHNDTDELLLSPAERGAIRLDPATYEERAHWELRRRDIYAS